MEDILNWITTNQQIIYIVILMIFVAIHGVVVIGAIIIMGKAEADNYLALILGFLAVVVGTLNVVGGFVVTDRMLEMFNKEK